MVAMKLSRGRAALVGMAASVFSVLLGTIIFSAPAHAANVQVNWVNATSVRISGLFATNQTVQGAFMGNVYGTPPGSLTFVASTGQAVQTTFGCKVSMSLNVLPDANGAIDYSKGRVVFTMTPPTTCSELQLKANINGLAHDPNIADTDFALNVTIGSVDNRTPKGGGATGAVNVTAGMGVNSDYNSLPDTDTFMLCEAKGQYANNMEQLTTDCLAKAQGALSAPLLTSAPLATIPNGQGPRGGDEKGWTGTFNNVGPGTYMVCSSNFQACQLFPKESTAIDVRIAAGDTPNSSIPGTPPGQGAEEKVCTTGDGLAGTLAYILCPFTKMIADATSFFEKNIIMPFMTISPLTTNDKNPTYLLWQNVRNLANVGFILFFFFIILSQATSLGLSNYGIKKVLPRLLIVALGINLSYFIVAFIIDAFNIFGAGISQLVMAALQQASVQQQNTGATPGTVQSIFIVGGVALAAIVVTGGAVIGWLFGLIGLAFLFILVTVVILIIRQIAIIMFVIIAPVAILMYMLPNTESFFTRWRQNLIQLLMMYPILVLLFAAGKIFGVLINSPDFKIAMIIEGFGSIMFAPLHFIAQATGTTGGGLSDQAVTAVRGGLSFTANALPLGAAPAVVKGGGWLGNKLGSGMSKVMAGSVNRKKQEAALMGQEARMRAAKIPGVGRIAGAGIRKKAVLESRQTNLRHAEQDYLAKSMTNSARMQRQAAGVGGTAGRTRAAASAASVAAKGRKEDIDNEMALLDAEMRRLATNPKDLASSIARYYENPNGSYTDAKGQTRSNAEIVGSNGETFNLRTQGAGLQRALLNSAASQGEIRALEQARMSSQVNQNDLDDVIRANESKLKEKGGYHLATDFSLAAGRGLTGNDPASQTTMQAQRILAMAQSGANSVAGMKGGLLGDTAKVLNDPTQKAAIHAEMDRIWQAAGKGPDASALRDRLNKTMESIRTNNNTMARTEASEDTVKEIRDGML